MVRVTGGWARHGKEPNSFQDYSVLESAGAFSANDYAAILERYAVGNPPLEKTGEEALPWITLSEVQDDHHSYLGVSVQSWTDDVDGAGRPIVQTLYGCFPYPQFTRAPVSYRELAAVVRRLGPGGLDPAGVEVAGYAPEEIERDLRREGWLQRALAAAAMLLEGSVTITGAGGLSVDDRLRFLDAVAAVLPYGWRTRFTASTWFRGGGPYIQLAFARHSRGQGYDLDWWAEPVQVPPGAAVATAYLREFGELLDRRGFGLLELVDFLGRQTESLAEAKPYRAVEVLEEFDRPGTVLQRALQDSVETDELARLFESGRYAELPRPQDRVFLLFELIDRSSRVSSEVISKVCLPLRDAPPNVRNSIWGILMDRAYHHVWGDSPGDGRADSYLKVARCFGRVDDLLARLLTPNPSAVLEIGDDRVATLGALVARWADPEGAPMPQTMAALQACPILACALIIDLHADARDRLSVWLRALAQVMPGELLGPFARLLREPVLSLSAMDLAGVARCGENCLSALLWLATDRGLLNRVVPPFAEWLATLPEASQMPWADRLRALVPDRVPERAMLDVLLLRTGALPEHLETAVGPEWDGYLAAFRRAVGTEGWLAPALPDAQQAMVDYLRRSNWAADGQQIRAVIQVVEVLCAVPRQDWAPLARAVLRGRAITPAMIELPEYRRWWRKVAEAYPELDKEQYMTSLTALPPGARADVIGRLAAEALWRGTPARQVLVWITQSEARPSGEAMLEVVTETRRALIRMGARPHEANRKALEMARILCDGREYTGASAFRKAVGAQARDELDYQFELIQTASTVGPDLRDVEVTGRAREALQLASEWIRDLTGKNRLFFRRG